MANIEKRSSKHLSRDKQVDRAFRRIVATGISATALVVFLVLMILGFIGGLLPALAAGATASLGYGTYRALHP